MMASKHHPFLLLLMVACCLLPLTVELLLGDATPLTSSFHPRLGSSFRKCHQNFELKEANCKKRGLDSVPQSLSEDIVRLNLKKNNLSIIFNSSFQRYPLITNLDLSVNDIRMIEYRAFYPLKDLTYLDISENLHLVLPDSGLFRWATKLSTLNLTSANLKWLPNDTLKWISNSDTISLNHNQLSSVNFSSCGRTRIADLSWNRFKHFEAGTFNFACHTDTLALTGNPIQSVDPSVIASLNVRALVLGGRNVEREVFRNICIGISRSKIESFAFTNVDMLPILFSEGTFDSLRNHYISVLDLTGNGLEDQYPLLFSNLNRVRKLTMGLNDFQSLPPGLFGGMQELKVLQVDRNNLDDINPENETWTIDLNELNISQNRFIKISEYSFVGLYNLTLLDLRSNPNLVALELGSFTGLDSIQTVYLSECNIVHLWRLTIPHLESLSLHSMTVPFEPGESFKGTQFLVNLDMINVELSIVHLWNATQNVSLFDGLSHLKTLDMSENPGLSIITNLPLGIFRQLSALQELNLEYCKIRALHPLLFARLYSLQKLVLRGNTIKQLHSDLLTWSKYLKSIDLEGNLLTHLSEDIFSNNKILTNISLANNKISLFNKSTFTPMKSSLSSLDLSGNPIICNCDLKWLLVRLNGPIRLINEEATSCSFASMLPLREKPLLDFDVNILCTSDNILLVCLIPLAGISVIVIVVLVYHNRWPLRYKFFLLKLAALGYMEIQDARDHNDYEFDLNVIFYDDDEEWVRQFLQPALEEQLLQFQRNKFGDGDLVPGMYYLDSVDYVVSHSYKTIILLSRAAVRDRWFMLKFRTAMDHVSDTQTEFVVVVFLEDIPDDEIPFLARLFLRDGRPYLHWTEDVRGHEYFWGKLVKTLTINLRTNDLVPNE